MFPLSFFVSYRRLHRTSLAVSLKTKMNLISVYLVVGAISFLKCEFGCGQEAPFQNQIYSDDWQAKRENRSQGGGKAEVSGSLGESNPLADDFSGENKEFFEGFRRIRKIYFECKTKLSRSFKKKVKSPLPELKNYVLSLYQCVKVFSLKSLDEFLEGDFVPVTDFVYFVRDGVNVTGKVPSGRMAAPGHPLPLKDYSTRVLGKGWTALLHDRVENLLRSHSLKFQMSGNLISKGRARRRDHRMFAMMVMGFMIMASILIPMGFQFLTVLGGKSLLLAKLALIMSAINGLKKIATSNVGYGFYHTGNDGHHHDHIHHGFHEKNFHANPQNYNGLQGYNL